MIGESTQSFVNSVFIAVFGSGLVFISTMYWNSKKHLEEKAAALELEKKETQARVTALEAQLALVNQAVVPISTAFQAILIKELTHYHTPEMDALLVKVGPPNKLTTEEHDRLIVMLKERTTDLGAEISPSERDAAHILPAIMARAKAEQEVLLGAEALKIKLVTVAAVVGARETTSS